MTIQEALRAQRGIRRKSWAAPIDAVHRLNHWSDVAEKSEYMGYPLTLRNRNTLMTFSPSRDDILADDWEVEPTEPSRWLVHERNGRIEECRAAKIESKLDGNWLMRKPRDPCWDLEHFFVDRHEHFFVDRHEKERP